MMLHRHFEKLRNIIHEPPKETKAISIADRMNHKRPRTQKKAAVYAGTKNLYRDMETAAKSMLMNSPVDKVYFLIETDVFPAKLPDCIECVNVRDQRWFHEYSANARTPWTYMCLMKMTLAKLFPDYDRILMIDVDTIVDADISELWYLDMENKYFAMVREYMAHPGTNYHNCGVLLQNLKAIRKDKVDDKLIHILATEKLHYPEQDAMDKYCQDGIMHLEQKYNGSFCCGYADDVAIWHYAGTSQWQNNPILKGYQLQAKYRNIPWDEVMRIRKERYGK